jgi:hypothetical protein
VAGRGGVVTLAGAAGLAVRACDRGGAVTVTVGTVRVGAVSDAAGGASGVVCGAGVAGVSDAGGLLAGGVSGAGVCDEATPVKQSSTSAELLRRCNRLLRILMTAPQFLTGTTRPPRDRRITAKRRRAGCRRGRRWREGVPAPDRCQAVGGARAANSGRCGEGKSKASGGSLGPRTEMSGSGKDGGSARTKAPARWISVQIAQWSSARSCRSVGSVGLTCAAFDASAVATANLSADIGAARSRCTWPNVSASWSASANSARYAPNFDRDRNQSIRRRAWRLTSAADLFLRADAGTLVTMLHYGNWTAADSSIAPFGFISRVAKNPQWRERASARAATHATYAGVFEGKARVSGLRASR